MHEKKHVVEQSCNRLHKITEEPPLWIARSCILVTLRVELSKALASYLRWMYTQVRAELGSWLFKSFFWSCWKIRTLAECPGWTMTVFKCSWVLLVSRVLKKVYYENVKLWERGTSSCVISGESCHCGWWVWLTVRLMSNRATPAVCLGRLLCVLL